MITLKRKKIEADENNDFHIIKTSRQLLKFNVKLINVRLF